MQPLLFRKHGSKHGYDRCGAWAYLAALDVHQAHVFRPLRCPHQHPTVGLVEQVMTRPQYSQARRVFWIADKGSAHRGPASVRCLHGRFPRLILVHGPVHVSWLNHIEIYFSIVQHKVPSPNNFLGLETLAERLLGFQYYWESIAQPFQVTFIRPVLVSQLLSKCPPSDRSPPDHRANTLVNSQNEVLANRNS